MQFLWIVMFTLLNSKEALSQLNFNKYSVNPKIGFYIGGDSGGLTAGAEVNASAEKTLFSLDYFRSEEIIFFGNTPPDHYNQIGLMAGTYFGERLLRLELQGGIAPVWGKRKGKLIKEDWPSDVYNSENFFTVGLVAKAGFKLNPWSHFGLGFDIQANLNSKGALLMPMFTIGVGNIRVF